MIQPVFNTMIAIMLARFMLNDVPHALGMLPPPAYNSIAEYRAEHRAVGAHRDIRVVPTGPPRVPSPTFVIKRTPINTKTLDDLEATWRRIESDMSYDMQSALGILKEVMGHYYEEPAVVVYKGGDLVGVAVYEVGRDKDLQIDYTHIKELASFTHEPGVGRMLVDEIIEIARENTCDEVTASYGAGAKGFYDRLGFKLYEGAGSETGTLMVYKLKGGNPSGLPALSGFTEEEIEDIKDIAEYLKNFYAGWKGKEYSYEEILEQAKSEFLRRKRIRGKTG